MNRTRQLRRPILGLATLVLVSPLCTSLRAQEHQIDRDVSFVRQLARQMRFISLAQDEVTNLAKVYKQEAEARRIAQLGIEVSLVGATVNPNREAQRTLYADAIKRCEELIQTDPAGAVASEARATLANACQEFGQFLNEELEIAREDNPDAAKNLEEEAAAVFRAGVDACERVMESLRPLRRTSQEKELEYSLTWLRKGVLLREHARAVKEDRSYLADRAKQTLEELVLETGEETALGLRGLFEYAQCDQVMGETEDAVVMYEDTIEQIANSLEQSMDLGLGAETQQFLFNMMQEVYDRLTVTLFETGQIEKATEQFAKFREHLKNFGEEGVEAFEVADPRFGHLVFLNEARVLAESGEPEKVQAALETAKKINDAHPVDYVGVRAKAVIKGILEGEGGALEVSGALLFEVAKGEFQNKNFEEALTGIKRALSAMTPEEGAQHGLEAFDLMGRGYVLTERYLEGVLALKEGLVRFGASAGDSAEPVADRLDMAMRRLRQVTQQDPFFDRLNADVIDVVGRLGGAASGNKLQWKLGNQQWSNRKFKEAAAAYDKISSEFLYYELARARQAFALQQANDYPAARKAIADYREWLGSREARLERGRTDLEQVRSQAVAEIDYCDAYMFYREAVGDETAGMKKDLTKYPAAIDALKAFITNHVRTGANFVPRVYDLLGRLYCESGQMELADESYRSLKNVDPQGSLLPKLATVIFDAYLNQVDNLVTELNGAKTQGKDRAVIKGIEESLKQTRQKLVALGLEYVRSAAEPQYGMLSNTMAQLDELGDWARVDEVARKIIDLYGTNPDYTDRIDLVVRPKVGEAMLQQKQFDQAFKMLTTAEKNSPNNWEVKRLVARALGGWFYFDDRGVGKIVPGLEKFEEAYEKFYVDYKPWGLRPDVAKYSLDWYRFYWEAYWFALQAAKKNTTYLDYAKSLFRTARSTNDFASLKNLDEELWQMFNSNRPTGR